MKIYNKNNKIKNKKYTFKKIKNKNNVNHKKHDLSLQNFVKPKKNIVKKVIITKNVSILDLSKQMAIKTTELIKKFTDMGNTVTIDQILDQETAQLLVEEMGHSAILNHDNSLEEKFLKEHDILRKKFSKKIRPPIVTIMGHVDHGKTSLLDYIRSTKVAINESGGITQHIGAYPVKIDSKIITFLDTPGHAAFTGMRARGAQVTDIVILVVAGDDGVKPQTIEAIQHAKLAQVPILVAINKSDKTESNSENIKKELVKYDIVSEEWGGETIFVNISAITGQGINDLLSSILLQAEILELFATFSGAANGVVVESRLDKYRGPTATILIREGQLNKGDNILCGIHYGKVRVMKDIFGIEMNSIGPSIPVEISGLSGVPVSGDTLYTAQSLKQAREIALYRQNRIQENLLSTPKPVNVNNVFKNLNKDEISIINIILKADFKGSLEAIIHVIQNLSSQQVYIKIISMNVGDITETDVTLAITTNSIIVGFNVKANAPAKRLIKKENVDVRYYCVIYTLIDDIKLMVSDMTIPKYKTLILGSAEIRDIFKPTKSIFIAGCMVINGLIKRMFPIHIIRNKKIIYKGELESLRRFKDDVKEVSVGKECGIGIKNYNDVCIGDIIESFKMVEIKHIN